uniref:DUF2213 domain-containing protein n=2 Tax=viral metagenome TaxID=1070528 RepID=A0A6M3IXL0_9ZZZZ
MPEHMERITMNLKGVVRHDSMEGQEYLVVPMVMIKEGVLNGSAGPLYYPASELSKTPVVWNHKPIVVYHPAEGQSACDPDIISNRKVGVIMNAGFVDGKVKAEAWLNKNRISVVDPRIGEAVENQTMMELSTGLFTDNEPTEGVFNGKAYTAIARNYRPDHLALLPDLIGACSIADGAGFMRMNQALENASPKIIDAVNALLKAAGIEKTVGNEIAHGDLWRLLSEAVSDTGVHVSEIFDTYFVYEDKEKLFKQSYSKVNDEITLVGNPIEVKKVVDFVPVTNKKEKPMDKTQLIAKIIANTGFGEEDQEYLAGLDEAALTKMLPVENETETKTEEKQETLSVDPPVVQEPVAPTENKTLTVNEYIAAAPAEMQGVLMAGLEAHNAQKAALVKTIVANERNTFKPEYLNTRPLPELQAIAKLATNKEQDSSDSNAIFLPQEEVHITKNTEAPLDLPVMNFSDK